MNSDPQPSKLFGPWGCAAAALLLSLAAALLLSWLDGR